jgi:soluble lytic murein transglycosylase-like protein
MDPRQNIMAGALYLRRLLDSHRGNIKLALASYNAGPGGGEVRAHPAVQNARLRRDPAPSRATTNAASTTRTDLGLAS